MSRCWNRLPELAKPSASLLACFPGLKSTSTPASALPHLTPLVRLTFSATPSHFHAIVALIVRRTAEPDWIRQLGVEKVKRKRNEKEQRRKERLQRKRREFSESFSTKRFSNTVNAGSLFGRVRLHTSTTAPGQTQSAEAQERSGPQRIQLEDELFLPEEDETSELGKRKQLGDSATEEASAFRADSLEVEDEEPETSQLIYCSRTHSQLSQVLKEFKKTRFRDRFKALPLAGRKQLCVNPDVLALGSASRINEACVDMQRPSRAKRSSSGSCAYLTKKARAHILGYPQTGILV